MEELQLRDEQFGPLLPYIKDDLVTDINWNGKELWIDDLKKGRYVADLSLEETFVNQFCAHISNVVSVNFNKHMPLMEAESNGLRISVIHEGYAHTGRSISIRKAPAVMRLNDEKMLADHYCDLETLSFLKNCVRSHMNIVMAGKTGTGKTEFLKYLTSFINPAERTITIEDNLEIHFREINPGKDCVELKVDDRFDYTTAIKACLRQLPTWILLSEARSVEVQYLIESLTTGHNCLTTLHTDDVRKVPDRMVNMIGDPYAAERISNDVYTFVDIAVLIKRKQADDGHIVRYIDQVGCMTREKNDKKYVQLIVNEGQIVNKDLPPAIMEKFTRANVEDPFVWIPDEEGKVII